jgi:hypothetical protein
VQAKKLVSTFQKREHGILCWLTKKENRIAPKANANQVESLNVDRDLLTGSVRTFPGGWLTRCILDLPLGCLVELSTTF